MRLERITLKGFLSHDSTDWQPNGARLATLVGPNGAGKSSLLDGVMYALFDGARGRTDDLVRLGSSDMAATVEFAYAAQRYRVTRGRTTRAGGKTFLELHVADGDGWRPLTADSIRDTQAAIEQLLRMDGATFATAAFLMQGRASAFAEATAAERKRILGTVLGLDLWERAEARARDMARDVESRAASSRDEAARLDEQLATRHTTSEALVAGQDLVRTLGEEIATHVAARDHRLRIRSELAVQLADSQAAAAEVTRLSAEISELKARWLTAKRRGDEAAAAVTRAEQILATEADVLAAGERLPELRTALEKAREREARTLGDLERAREELRRAETHHATRVAEHGSRKQVAEAAVASLERQLAELDEVECPKCGERFAADPGGLAGRLEVARQTLQQLPAAPAAPFAILRESTKVERLSRQARELPAETARLAGELVDVEVLARQASALEAAREAVAVARQQADEAAAEMSSVTEAGARARTALDAAQARVSAAESVRGEQQRNEAAIAELDHLVAAAQASERDAVVTVARLQSHLEALERAQARRDELTASLEAAARETALLRRLVAAFGVTGIPARIIESVLPELSRYANELLAELRPGMTLAIRAQRAKKSGAGVVEALDLVVRDDVGERPLAMFSGGERMGVSLALAVGLSRLVARRAGTAIRTLVVDEPDGLDANARRAFGQALRILSHAGELERVVLVSHHEDLAEVGDAIYQVSRNGSGSLVEQIA